MSYGFVRRLSSSARSVVIDAPAAARHPLRLGDLELGWAVVDIQGRRVGRVAEVDADRGRIVVAGGTPHRRALVPAERVAELQEGVVRLTLRSSEIGWGRGTAARR